MLVFGRVDYDDSLGGKYFIWVVATQIFFHFNPYLGNDPIWDNLRNILQMGWFNRQPVIPRLRPFMEVVFVKVDPNHHLSSRKGLSLFRRNHHFYNGGWLFRGKFFVQLKRICIQVYTPVCFEWKSIENGKNEFGFIFSKSGCHGFLGFLTNQKFWGDSWGFLPKQDLEPRCFTHRFHVWYIYLHLIIR